MSSGSRGSEENQLLLSGPRELRVGPPCCTAERIRDTKRAWTLSHTERFTKCSHLELYTIKTDREKNLKRTKFSDVFHSFHRPSEAGCDGFISFFVTTEEGEICENLLSPVLWVFMFRSCEKLKRRGKKKRERNLEWHSVEPNRRRGQTVVFYSHSSITATWKHLSLFSIKIQVMVTDKWLSFTARMNLWVLQGDV